MPVATYGTIAGAVDILLASAVVVLIGFAGWLFVHSGRASAIQLFGMTVHYPRVWATAAVCMGFHTLLGLANLAELTPSAWRAPSRWIGMALFLAGVALLCVYWVLRYRAKRRL